jgi:predicted PurR-regulated permease PerM
MAVALAGFAAAVAASRLDDVMGLIVSAAVLALLTLPITRWLSAVGRGFAIASTAVLSLVTALVVGLVALRDLRTQATSIAELVNDRIDDVESSTTAGRVISSMRIESAIEGWLARVPDLIVVGEESGTGIGRQLVALVTVVILAAFLQSSGGKVVDAFASRWPRVAAAGSDALDEPAADDAPGQSPRAEIRELLHAVDRRGLGAVRRSGVLVMSSFVVIALMADALSVPGAVVLGLWAGAWFAVPTIGWAVGLAPIGLVAWVESSPATTLAVLLTAVVGAIAIVTRRRYIDARTVRLGVGPYVIGLAVGVAMGGVVGSVVGLTCVAVAAVVLTHPLPLPPPSPWLVDRQRTTVVGGAVVPAGWRGVAVAAAGTATAVLIWLALMRATEAVVWILIGGFVAVAISRPVAFLVRRFGMHRLTAVGLLLTVGLLLVGAATITGADNGAEATTTVADELPAVVRDLEDSPVIGPWLADRDAAVWIEAQVNDLPQRVRTVRPADWFPAVGARVMDLFWTTLVAIALLIDGQRLVERSTRLVPVRGRRQFVRLTGAIGTALGGYAAGAALVAGINGAVVFAIAVLVGIGLAPILAAWAFVWNFVPQIGGFIGGMPLILFALIAGPTQALVAGVAFVIYQFVENNLIQPTVIGAAIDVPPWGTLVAALAGAAAAGVIGAIVLTPLVGVVRVVRTQLRSDDFPGVTVDLDSA